MKYQGSTVALEVDARNVGRWRRCVTLAHVDMPEDWASRSNVGIIAQTSEVSRPLLLCLYLVPAPGGSVLHVSVRPVRFCSICGVVLFLVWCCCVRFCSVRVDFPRRKGKKSQVPCPPAGASLQSLHHL